MSPATMPAPSGVNPLDKISPRTFELLAPDAMTWRAEYTERWHHQQQIRDAVGAPLLLDASWTRPLLAISMRAVPRALAPVSAEAGTVLAIAVEGEGGASWSLLRNDDGWSLLVGGADEPTARVRTGPDTAWRLLYNALATRETDDIITEGDHVLASRFLKTRSVMV